MSAAVRISVFEDRATLPSPSLGRLLKDRTGKSQLKQMVASRLKALAIPSSRSLASPALQHYADAYGEQVTNDSPADLQKFFASAASRGFTPGQIRTGLSPLAILPRDVRPSNTAISVLAEGLAGWYLERRGMLALARPIGDEPDLIFQDPAAGTVALVQVKGTQEPDIRARLTDAAVALLNYGSHVKHMVGPAPVSCLVVGVVILTPQDFELYCVETELV